MTLIVAVQEGLYTDRRIISDAGNHPDNGPKFVKCPKTGIVLGITGHVHTYDRKHYATYLEGINALSWAVDLLERAEQYNTLTNLNFEKLAINLGHHLEIKTGASHILVVTKAHNIEFNADKAQPDTPNIMPAKTFNALGSSGSIAHLFHRSGIATKDIFHRAAQIDDMITREYNFTPRPKATKVRIISESLLNLLYTKIERYKPDDGIKDIGVLYLIMMLAASLDHEVAARKKIPDEMADSIGRMLKTIMREPEDVIKAIRSFLEAALGIISKVKK